MGCWGISSRAVGRGSYQHFKTFCEVTWIRLEILCGFGNKFCDSFVGDIYFLKEKHGEMWITQYGSSFAEIHVLTRGHQPSWDGAILWECLRT